MANQAVDNASLNKAGTFSVTPHCFRCTAFLLPFPERLEGRGSRKGKTLAFNIVYSIVFYCDWCRSNHWSAVYLGELAHAAKRAIISSVQLAALQNGTVTLFRNSITMR